MATGGIKISKIDFTSKTDFTNGFSSWHIRWPIKNLNLSSTIKSSNFDTSVKNGNGTTVYTWSVGFKVRETSVWFGLYPKNLPVPAGINFRWALRDGNKDPFFNESYYGIFFDLSTGLGRVETAKKALSFVGDNLEFHCWIDIPNDDMNDYVNKRKLCDDEFLCASSFRLKGCTDMLIDVSEFFHAVIFDDEQCKDNLSDVTLIAWNKDGKSRRFNCHRFILAARSPVYKTMFASEQWKERTANGDWSVEIEDIDALTMVNVLRYIYTGYIFPKENLDKKNLDSSALLDVINAAEKYLLPNLKDFCVAHLICHAYSDKERLEQFVLADRYRLPQLKAVCIASLTSNFEGIGGENDETPDKCLIELYKEMAKRNIDMKEICLTG